MRRLSFSSPGAAAGAEEARRLARWWDEHSATFRGTQVSVDLEAQFAARVEQLTLGDCDLGLSQGPIKRFYTGRRDAARFALDRFQLLINRDRTPAIATSGAAQYTIHPGCAALLDLSTDGELFCSGGHQAITLSMPRPLLRNAMTSPEDFVGTVIRPDNDALRLIVRYAAGWLEGEDVSHPAVLAQAGRNFLDLLVLAFGSDRDNVEASRLGGLRAARLDAALRLIRAGYTDPTISPPRIAARLGITTRYLHKLLHETGASFAERVQELRLEKAFTLLTSQSGATAKVHEAAYDSGFSDLSHFNRQFRRKYGITPTAARGREG